jgi:hypothetical protein
VPSAVIDTANKTVTVAQAGARQFYKLSSATSTKIIQVKKVGSNIVMTYQ